MPPRTRLQRARIARSERCVRGRARHAVPLRSGVGRRPSERFNPPVEFILALSHRILPVERPSLRVGQDVVCDSVQVALVSDNVLEVATLPDPCAGVVTQPMHTPRDGRLERTNYCGQRPCNRPRIGLLRRGTACRARAFNVDYPVHVIRHDDESAQPEVLDVDGDFLPAAHCHLSPAAETHTPRANTAENGPLPVGTDCHEVCASCCVVVVRQPGRAAGRQFAVRWHQPICSSAKALGHGMPCPYASMLKSWCRST